jgi:hypothetical protein
VAGQWARGAERGISLRAWQWADAATSLRSQSPYTYPVRAESLADRSSLNLHLKPSTERYFAFSTPTLKLVPLLRWRIGVESDWQEKSVSKTRKTSQSALQCRAGIWNERVHVW